MSDNCYVPPAVRGIQTDATVLRGIVQGSATTVVQTDNGPVPSAAKRLAEAAARVNYVIKADLAELRNYQRAAGVGLVYLLGDDLAGDGGGGAFYYDVADTASNDDGATVAVGADGARWKRLRDRKAGMRFGSILHAQAAAIDGSLIEGEVIEVLGFDVPGDGGDFLAIVEAADDPLLPIGGRIKPVGASVHPQMWGAAGDGSANDTLAMLAAKTYAAARGVVLALPVGTYLLDAGGAINFAAQRLHIVGIGNPTLKFIGSGIGFNMDTDAGPGLSPVGEMNVGGFTIEGGPDVTDGFFSRGVVRGEFRNIEVRECSDKAFNIQHGVASIYTNFKCSTNSGPMTTLPQYGLYLTHSGNNYYTADCTFVNPAMEGFPGTGIHLDAASGNTFLGGTSEAVAKGVVIVSGCRRNSFQNLWCEANTVADVEDYGVGSSFTDCFLGSNGALRCVELITSQGARFTGGFIRRVNAQSTSSRTTLVGVGLSDHPSLGITGAGRYAALGCFGVNTSGNRSADIANRFDSETGVFIPRLEGGTTVGSATYLKQAGQYVKTSSGYEFTIEIVISGSFAPGSGPVQVMGLPFPSPHAVAVTVGGYGNITLPGGGTQLVAEILAGRNYINLSGAGSNMSFPYVTVANLGSSVRLLLSGTIRTV